MKKMILSAVVIVVATGILFMPALSLADFSVGFLEDKIGNFNLMTAYATNGNFVSPGFSNFTDSNNKSVSDWNSTFVNSISISAMGNSVVTYLFFTVTFAGTLNADYSYSGPLSFEFRVFNGGVLVDWATIAYKGSGSVLDTNNNWTYTSRNIKNSSKPTTGSK